MECKYLHVTLEIKVFQRKIHTHIIITYGERDLLPSYPFHAEISLLFYTIEGKQSKNGDRGGCELSSSQYDLFAMSFSMDVMCEIFKN